MSLRCPNDIRDRKGERAFHSPNWPVTQSNTTSQETFGASCLHSRNLAALRGKVKKQKQRLICKMELLAQLQY